MNTIDLINPKKVSEASSKLLTSGNLFDIALSSGSSTRSNTISGGDKGKEGKEGGKEGTGQKPKSEGRVTRTRTSAIRGSSVNKEEMKDLFVLSFLDK